MKKNLLCQFYTVIEKMQDIEFVHSISCSTAPPLNYSVPKCEVIVNKFNGKRFCHVEYRI